MLNIENIRKILIIQWSSMGDCVLASGTFDDIRNYFPKAEIHLNVLSPWNYLFEHDPRINKIINFPIRKAGIKATIKWLTLIKNEQYDLIIDFQGNDRTHILLTLCKLLCIKKGIFLGRKPAFCYDLAPENLKKIHVFERFQLMLQKLGITPTATSPHLVPMPKHIEHVQNKLRDLHLDTKKYAIFIPGCSPQGALKLWPSDYFIALSQKIFSHGFDHIILLGAHNEEALCQKITQTDARFVNLCSQTELLEIALWCKNAHLIIGNDTGAAHIAASTGVPQIALFGPTNSQLSRPYGQNVLALNATDVPHPINLPESSMSNLTPEYVWDAYKTHFSMHFHN